MTLRKKWQCVSLLLSAVLLAACGNEEDMGFSTSSLQEGGISLQWIPAKMGVYKSDGKALTRGTDPKEEAEQQINNIHVFLFDQDGNYLQPSTEGGASSVFQGYKYQEGDNNWVLQSELFADQTKAANAIIYVVANVPQDYFGALTTQGYPKEVPDMAALESLSYRPKTFSASISATGLPMVVKQEGDISMSATSKLIALKLRSMMARIDLSLRIQADDACDDELHPSFTPTSILLHNFPLSGTFKPQIENTTNALQTTGEVQEVYEVSASPLLNREIYNNTATVTTTFYMFEHSVPTVDNYPYPDGIQEVDKQRYKPWLYQEGAFPAYIELKGDYINHNLYEYHVTYSLYLGGNPIDDFTIGTNRQYKNSVTIKGITANDVATAAEALLDTRVNIDETTNPYFIEMLRERKHDAHFNVTPMDVYMAEGSKLVISIKKDDNGQIPDWIRMEPIGRVPTEAGDGKRDYFTMDLMDELERKSNSQTYEATIPGERIYFYIDENLSEDPREATIHIQYYDYANGALTSERDISIEQEGLFNVYIDKFADGKNIYLEYYEEYLNHFDPLNEYTDTVPGYVWGADGVNVHIPYQNAAYMQNGEYCTEQIISELGHFEMTLNEVPRTAAEYCYNKNKRDKDGNVTDMKWYLPAIAELEYFLEDEFTTFKDFQDNFYWSSSPAYYSYEDTEHQHARSTKIIFDSNEGYVHTTSDRGQAGFKRRTERLRIRCARKDLRDYSSY